MKNSNKTQRTVDKPCVPPYFLGTGFVAACPMEFVKVSFLSARSFVASSSHPGNSRVHPTQDEITSPQNGKSCPKRGMGFQAPRRRSTERIAGHIARVSLRFLTTLNVEDVTSPGDVCDGQKIRFTFRPPWPSQVVNLRILLPRESIT